MIISRICPFTNDELTMDIDVTQQQLDYWRAGALIQDIMPHLTPSEREFIKTGITDWAWGQFVGEEE